MKTFSLNLRFERFVALLLLSILLLVLAVSALPAQTIQKSDTSEVVVTSVVDGDTFYCAKDGDTAKVRVLGFDAYESRFGKRLTDQAARANIDTVIARKYGVRAKEFAKELLQEKTVILHRGNKNAPNLDKYGRLLRFVLVDDTRFEETMIAKGFAAPRRP